MREPLRAQFWVNSKLDTGLTSTSAMCEGSLNAWNITGAVPYRTAGTSGARLFSQLLCGHTVDESSCSVRQGLPA
jgi:hypothetical protein